VKFGGLISAVYNSTAMSEST